MWSDWGWSLGEGTIFILAEGVKIDFLVLLGRESSLLQTFCESSVHLDIAHPSIHMTQICDSRLSYLKRREDYIKQILYIYLQWFVLLYWL